MWKWLEHLEFWQVLCLAWVILMGLAAVARGLRGRQ